MPVLELLLAGALWGAAATAPAPATRPPVEISADALEARKATHEVRFHGHVVVKMGTLVAHCEDLIAHYDASGREIRELETIGPTEIEQEGRRAFGTGLRYWRGRRLAVLAGPAHLAEGTDRVDGAEMEFHLADDRLVVHGAHAVYRPRSGDLPGLEGIVDDERKQP